MECDCCYQLSFSFLSVKALVQTYKCGWHFTEQGYCFPVTRAQCGGGGEWGQGLLMVGLHSMKALGVGVYSPFAPC